MKRLLALLTLLVPLASLHAAPNPVNPNKTMTPKAEATNQSPTVVEPINVPIAAGPCAPNWKSLGDNFKCPVWWRQAKIGVWLHWGPQSIGEDGDWYAKWIYMPSHAWGAYSRVYTDHLERVGHPSITGYKDMLPLWKAENGIRTNSWRSTSGPAPAM